jgi:hypothetical protein
MSADSRKITAGQVGGQPEEHGGPMSADSRKTLAGNVSGQPVDRAGPVSAHLSAMPSTRSLRVGDRAPLFTLPSSTGQPVDLADYLSRGPVVLAWYLFDFGRV